MNPTPYALNCRRCALRQGCRRVVLGEGPYPAKLMIIGEAPGDTEDQTGRPFVGACGKYLRDTLTAVGIDPAECYITNANKCRPPANRHPKNEEIAACRPWLGTEIAAVRPELIVAFGDTAATALFGSGVGHKYRVEKGVGKKGQTLYREPTLTELRRRDDLRYENDDLDIPVQVAFHPSAAMQYEKFRAPFVRDVERIAERLGLRASDALDRKYYELTSPETFTIPVGATVALDTEFEDERLVCYSFATTENEAWVVFADQPWAADHLRSLLDRAGRIVMHSAQADVPYVCRAASLPLGDYPYAKLHDTAVQAYVLGKRPIALKSLAENELGLKVIRLDDIRGKDGRLADVPRALMVRYSAQDADLTLRLDARFMPELRAA